MLNYLSSRSKSIKAEIKQSPNDFIVEEIMPDGTVLELNKSLEKKDSKNKFVHFVLQKESWSTSDAAREIASNLHVSQKRINYAGTKDKNAITTQVMSVYEVEKECILKLKINKMKILGAWYANEKIDLGMLLGNRFRIKVIGEINEKTVHEILAELNGKFPNYFGSQRFGTKQNTHLIGEKLLKSEFRSALEIFLTNSEGETNINAKESRKKLSEENDYKKALDYFPKYLKLERMVIHSLAENPYDYAGALRKLPRQILLLFVHAFQSHLFNLMLSERIKEGEFNLEGGEYYCGEKFGFPDLHNKTGQSWIAGKLLGYESELNKREEELLERFEIRKNDFKMRALPEINCKGTYRALFAPLKDFEYMENEFKFSLPAGSYATSALREFIKSL